MPGRLKVKVLAGRHLPVMDRASELTDAFVEVKFGSVTHKTEVYSKSLNPYWNSEWFAFEVDDEHLQDEPLQIRVLDHDTYSSHDAIGKVYIDVDPLLAPDSANALHGWFPIYDTMHGIRGEILLTVKIELFADFNRFKKSSCGIKFVCGTVVPECYRIAAIQGFVEELVVSEDPEYQWIDKLRTPRATNEARQRLFSQVSGELQRRIGMKVMEMGGNAVVGYHQHFDIEGEFGVVVRGIGTAVSLESHMKSFSQPRPGSPTSSSSFSPPGHSPISSSPVKFCFPHRSSSLESDPGSLPQFRSHLNQSANASNAGNEILENMEHPFFTLTTFPLNFIQRLGGVVSAHSVKLLDKIHNPDEPETRDAWWSEIRQEIKSHASVLACNAVVGYKEVTSICDELIVLSAQGTAAVINTGFLTSTSATNEAVAAKDKIGSSGPYSAAIVLDSSNPFEKMDVRRRHNSGEPYMSTPPQGVPVNGLPLNPLQSNSAIFQAPYLTDPPFPITLCPSPLDSSVQVPEVLFTTIDVPQNVHITGKGTIIQARFCRSKKKNQGETNAAVVGDILPFVEYELHKQLYNKLKLRGMNALFGLRVHIKIGENLVIGIATATAAYVTALPPTAKPLLNCQNVKHGSSLLENIQQQFDAEVQMNKDHFDLQPLSAVNDLAVSEQGVSSEVTRLNLSSESKQSLPVSIEDPDDVEQLRSMIDGLPPKHCYMSNCQSVPGVPLLTNNIQTFSTFLRVKYREGAGDRVLNRGLRATCEKVFTSMWYRLNRLGSAFCLCGLRFNLIVPEDDEIHIWVTASAVGYRPLEKAAISNEETYRSDVREHVTNELQFDMDTDDEGLASKSTQVPKNNVSSERNEIRPSSDASKLAAPNEKGSAVTAPERQKLSGSATDQHSSVSPLRLQITDGANQSAGSGSAETRSGSEREGSVRRTSGEPTGGGTASRHIELSPLGAIAGRRVQRHIGFVNMFLVRETSAVRGGEDGLPGTEIAQGTGSNWFAYSVMAETQALLRAHVAALGGNALTSYRVEQCALSESVAKNQAQCLIHVCGDAVVCTPQK